MSKISLFDSVFALHYQKSLSAYYTLHAKNAGACTGKVVLFLTSWCSSYQKGSLRVTLNYGRQLFLLISIIDF